MLKFLKRILSLVLTKAKLGYTRIALTRLTFSYFILAFVSCIVLVILQGVTLADNYQAANIISDTLYRANITQSVTILSGGVLQICDGLPHQQDITCTSFSRRAGPTPNLTSSHLIRETIYSSHSNEDAAWALVHSFASRVLDEHGAKKRGPTEPMANMNFENIQHAQEGKIKVLNPQCLQSLVWLKDSLRDATREDLVILCFQFWMFALAFMTVFSESLPHLIAGVAGHLLGTIWAGYRFIDTRELATNYIHLILFGPCDGFDLLGGWWDAREQREIPVIVINVLALLAISCISLSLYKMYTTQSFDRVGASSSVHKAYKIVLFLSVSLQLAGFFSLASTAIWIDKISSDTIHFVAHHYKIYLAAFITVAILQIPWLILGWVSVRREYRRRFLVFCVLSIVTIFISTAMFISPLYRFIFSSWPFFATITVTSYIFVLGTFLLGIWCRLHFGMGLAHFLQVSKALAGIGFTPVYFSKDVESTEIKRASLSVSHLDLSSWRGYPQKPETMYHNSARPHVLSVYSEAGQSTVKLSSTPFLIQTSVPRSKNRLRKLGSLETFRSSKRRSYIPSSNTSIIMTSRSLEISLGTRSNSSNDRVSEVPSVFLSRSTTPLPPVPSGKPGLPSSPRLYMPNGSVVQGKI